MRRRKPDLRPAKVDLAWDFAGSLQHPQPGMIKDASRLPAPKDELIDALLFMIANAQSIELADAFTVVLGTVAEYQEGVGEQSLDPVVDASIPAGKLIAANKKFMQFAPLMAAETRRFEAWSSEARKANLHLRPKLSKIWDRFRGRGLNSLLYDGYIDFGLHKVS